MSIFQRFELLSASVIIIAMTLRQQKATQNLVENGSTLKKAMIDAGYSPKTAIDPGKLTRSKGFQEIKKQYQDALIAKGLDHAKLADKMVEWIDAVKVQSSMTEPDRVVPDYQIQVKAGDMLRDDFGLTAKNTVNVLNQGEMTLELIGNE